MSTFLRLFGLRWIVDHWRNLRPRLPRRLLTRRFFRCARCRRRHFRRILLRMIGRGGCHDVLTVQPVMRSRFHKTRAAPELQ